MQRSKRSTLVVLAYCLFLMGRTGLGVVRPDTKASLHLASYRVDFLPAIKQNCSAMEKSEGRGAGCNLRQFKISDSPPATHGGRLGRDNA